MKNKITSWLENNKHYFIISSHKYTWLHFFASFIHCTCRLISLINFFIFLQKKYKPNKVFVSKDLKQKLYAKLDLYQQLIKNQQDQDGFIETNHCDSLLYSSWVGCTGTSINIKAAQDSDKFWHRRPIQNPCYPQNSQSTISRDMILGLLWFLYFTKNINLAKELLQSARKNNFVLGLGIASRLVLMPPLEATLAEIIFKLGGENSRLTRNQIQFWPSNLKGYTIKLAVAHALLRGKLKGYITKSMLKMFLTYAQRHPESPLLVFAANLYTTGNMDQVIKLLLDENLWPTERLPTNHDRSEYWLVEKTNPLDFLPEPHKPLKIHSGGDFIFYAWLVKYVIEHGWE